MQQSIDRILTTHAGSIPRGEALGAMLLDQERGSPVDRASLDALVDARVAHVLAKEAEVGIDSANDGEQARVGFQTYIPQRMDGFGGVSKRPFGGNSWSSRSSRRGCWRAFRTTARCSTRRRRS